MRNLVKRYVAAMIRDAKTEEGLTEENFKVTIFVFITMRSKPAKQRTSPAHLESILQTQPCVLAGMCPFCFFKLNSY